MTNNFTYFFLYLFTICVSSFVNYSNVLLLLIRLLVFLLLNSRNSLYNLKIEVFGQICVLWIFSPNLDLAYSFSLWYVLMRRLIFWVLMKSNLSWKWFLRLLLSKKTLPSHNSRIYSPIFSSKSFIVLAFKFHSMIHLSNFCVL